MRSSDPRITAILGPTNTGKTHLAVERLCAHDSGVMGFPLRLLAREVYERVVTRKGADKVALITGEEKIVPPRARYFLSTVEAMSTPLGSTPPGAVSPAFVAVDEAQMGADRERGHVFTDRLLRARGHAETMILGSATVRPLIRALVPQAEIISRPRLSVLRYTGARKLSRLPKRSAIVAFSAEQVYAIGEMVRRQQGGVAIVMGALSPQTRNAQVAMYQAGEVDYLVATDAIGMGLNMDIAHVAFAALSKFDGRSVRRLTVAEMAQIAGRAGRFSRDGTFGTVQLEEKAPLLQPEEIEAIEAHEFPPLETLNWRNPELDFASIDALLTALEAVPTHACLRRAEESGDLLILRLLADDPEVRARARSAAQVRRLWAACQAPDFAQSGPERHAQFVRRLFGHLTQGRGTLPVAWIAAELARFDNTQGDIETVAARIAGVRIWSYVAHQAHWLDDPAEWAEKARGLETKLSDALHERLVQRFVDRRASALMRSAAGRRGSDVAVGDDGVVEVEGQSIGQLAGFTFTVDPSATHEDKRRALAAAERSLPRELARRALALVQSESAAFTLVPDWEGGLVRLTWRGAVVAVLAPGRSPLSPQVRVTAASAVLPHAVRADVAARLEAFMAEQGALHLGPLHRLLALAEVRTSRASKEGKAKENKAQESKGRRKKALALLGGAARGLAVELAHALGCLPRHSVEPLLRALTRADRRLLAKLGVVIGVRHVYVARMLKVSATFWRAALWMARHARALPEPPSHGEAAIMLDPRFPAGVYTVLGYWPVSGGVGGMRGVRVDLVERLAGQLRAGAQGGGPVVPTAAMQSGTGLAQEEFVQLVLALGYRRKWLVTPAPLLEAEGEGGDERPGVAPARQLGFVRDHRGSVSMVREKTSLAERGAVQSPFAILQDFLKGNEKLK